uniref:Thymosin beta-10 n=1 Tax=Neovison vison TaxID=452646 RepID=A0A8C7ERA5_NEOVI
VADKPDMGEMAGFAKAKLKKTETQEDTLPTKETIEESVSPFPSAPPLPHHTHPLSLAPSLPLSNK